VAEAHAAATMAATMTAPTVAMGEERRLARAAAVN
jgi:hypothetical protein